MQTSDKERFIWVRNSLKVLVRCPDSCSRALAARCPVLSPCAIPLRPHDAQEGTVCAQETRTEDISGTCDDYRAGSLLQVHHTAGLRTAEKPPGSGALRRQWRFEPQEMLRP